MELALPLSCCLLWFCLFGQESAESLPRSSLVIYENESLSEVRERCEGIVLITTNQSADLVCDDQWSVDSTLAHVVCKESGCGEPNRTWTLRSSLPSSLEFVQGMKCSGNEETVRECEESESAVQNCTLQSVAAVTCNPNAMSAAGNHSMRLSKGRNPCDGHVEVFMGNMWSPVCYSGVKERDPEVLCQQMECKSLRPAFAAVHKGKSLGAVLFQCQVNQSSVWDCDHHKVDICPFGVAAYLQCNRPRMEESWLVWTAICLAAVMIVAFCWVRATKSWKNCFQSLYRNIRTCVSCPSNTRERCRQKSKRRNIYEPPNLVVQESRSPPSSPAVLQNSSEVNALLAPHGFRLNNTITPPPSYMHALKVLSRPLENSQTPPPSYLEALKILSRPVLVHVHAAEDYEEKEDLTPFNHGEKNDTPDS